MLSTTMQVVSQAILVSSVLLLLAFGAMYALSRSYGRALLGFAGGVALLATAYYVMFPLIADQETARLREHLTTARAEEARARTDLARINREHTQLETDHGALTRRLDQTVRTHTAQLDEIQTEIDRARNVLTRRESGLELEPGQTFTTRSLERHDLIVARARELSNLRPRAQPPAPPAPQVEQRQDQVRGLLDLRERMAARMSTPSYDVEVYPDRELVGGRKGRYYVVDMKNAESGVRFFFEGGRYTLSRADGEFRRSINAFIGDVLGKLDGNVRYDLFVRGSADRTPYEGRFEDGQQIRQIRYLRNAGGDKYSADHGERTLGTTVRNQDLPELRANFLRTLVAESYPVKPPVILEGAVSTKANTKDRNAELILFVDW